MPAEAAPPPPPRPAPSFPTGLIKCDQCGGTGFPSVHVGAVGLSPRGLLVEGVHGLETEDPARHATSLESLSGRVCGQCARAGEVARQLRLMRGEDAGGVDAAHGYAAVAEPGSEFDSSADLGLGLEGMRMSPMLQNTHAPAPSPVSHDTPCSSPSPPPPPSDPVLIPTPSAQPSTTSSHAHSLPAHPPRPWTTARRSAVTKEAPAAAPSDPDRPYNPLLDLTTERISSQGRGALHPGSVFRGTQTSGRSAYDVEVRFLDVNLPASHASGYLSISHLTDTHPHLTTFFTAELIGPTHGFVTGGRWGATEHDDMRHWGRFEQFRRPSTRADMVRPELLFRDPQPDGTRGEREGRERDFVFMRIKERFLVPDHRVRDISGASFAGFYYAMLDLSPSADAAAPTSPTSPRSPLISSSPTTSYFPLPRASLSSASAGAGTTVHLPPVAPSAMAPSAASPAVGPAATAAAAVAESGMGFPAPGGLARDALGLAGAFPPVALARPLAARRASTTVLPGGLPGTQPPPPCETPSSPATGTGTGTAERNAPPSPHAAIRKRRESASRAGAVPEMPREATIRGYYFHSLNQEPFQELCLTHVPTKSRGVFELR